MIAELIKQLAERKDLDAVSAGAVMEEMLDGRMPSEEIAGFLTALAMKGESVTEISAFAQKILSRSEQLDAGEFLDLVGTGGDGAGTFNISTTSSFVAAAAGVKILKHGNRAASSKSGSADLLERLGTRLDRSPDEAIAIFRKAGIGFLYAPVCHRMSAAIGQARRSLGFRTIFNILGPLTNPARPKYEIMGVYDHHLIRPLAEVMMNLGIKRGIVLSGIDGLDEATLTGPTYCRMIRDGKFHDDIISPKELGLTRCSLDELRGGEPEVNAIITRRILNGEERGPKREVILLNAALAIYLTDLVPTLQEGIELAAKTIDSGKAAEKLHDFLEASR